MRNVIVALVHLFAAFGASMVRADVHDVKAAKTAAIRLNEAMDQIELKCRQKRLRAVRFWADQVGDLANDLDDELDDVDTNGSDHAVRKTFRELHGAYLNLRTAVKHVTDPKFRNEILKGTLHDFEDLSDAIYGERKIKNVASRESARKAVETEGKKSDDLNDRDGSDYPLFDTELDGVLSAEKPIHEKNSKISGKQ